MRSSAAVACSLALVLGLSGCGGPAVEVGDDAGTTAAHDARPEGTAQATAQATVEDGAARTTEAEQTSEPTQPAEAAQTPEPEPTAEADSPVVDLGDDPGAMPEPGTVSREEWLSWHWHQPEPAPPLPPVVREITMEEATRVWADCMTEAGVPVTFDPDGTISWEIPPQQVESVATIEWTCKAQYPWSAKYYQPWNDEQLQVLYEFQTGEVSQCAAAEGYPPPPPPSWEKFVADYRNNVTPRWFPLDGVPLEQIDLYQRVSDLCPVQPEDLYDLATVLQE